MTCGQFDQIGVTNLPEQYPFAAVPPAILLDWAHMVEPPYDQVRAAAPWLRSDGEVRHYLEGAIHGRIAFWRNDPLFACEGK